MKLFELIDAPLEGTHLIEAGAGTGKTYSIASIYLRLLLERNLNVDEILVLTYTRAATLELKERIRAKIAEMKQILSGNLKTKDELCAHLLKKAKKEKLVLKWIIVLEGALADFDNANVYNFHQFCQKVIKDYAVETGGLFDAEILPDNTPLLEQAAEDYWRSVVYPAEPILAGYLADKLKPATLISLVREVLSFNTTQSLSEILPPVAAFDMQKLENAAREMHRLFREIQNTWIMYRAEIISRLDPKALNATSYKKRLPVMPFEMDDFTAGMLPYPLPPGYDKWQADVLAKKTNKGCIVSEHEFFELWQAMGAAYEIFKTEADSYIAGLKIEAASYIKIEMDVLKNLQNKIDFDDQIGIVGKAVLNNAEGVLARQLKKAFKAVMVDEFQDTDALQYAMFSQLFADLEHLFFMIGDPKQAIYAFRGADVFSYFAAAKNTRSAYSLTTNWRSVPNLVYAVNHVFKNNPNAPFVVNDIAFSEAVVNAEKASVFDDAPLIFWYLDSRRPELGGNLEKKAKGEDFVLSDANASKAVVKSVAAEILKLLNADKGLMLKDFAVLVNNKHQANMVYKALAERNIPATLSANESVYQTAEANELLLILESAAQPDNLQKLKAAYTTTVLGGLSSEYLADALNDNLWFSRLQKINDWHKVYLKRGFLNMFLDMVFAENSFSRLLKAPDGRRKVTNFIHLAELLHRNGEQLNLTLTGLARFLRKAITGAVANDENALRLETDGDVVQIVTVHKSKGLEYEVVFYPFAWEGIRGKKQEMYKYHAANAIKLGFDKDAPEFKAFLRESLAEKLRLLYVALTRAKQRCYVGYGRIKTTGNAVNDKFETAALTYLLLGQEFDSQNPDLAPAMKKAFGAADCTDEVLRQALDGLAQNAQNRIRVADLPLAGNLAEKYAPETDSARVLRVMERGLDTDWKVASFSSLTKIIEAADAFEGRDWEQDAADESASLDFAATALSEPEPFGIFSMPKGAHLGNFFHDLLENIDFAAAAQNPPLALITEKLQEYNLDERFAKAVGDLVQNLCNADLAKAEWPLALKDVRKLWREMEFYFPLNNTTQEKLRELFLSGAYDLPVEFSEQGGRFMFAPAQGFLKGFIDLSFCCYNRYYIIDWKSNYEGPAVTDYNCANLQKSVAGHSYFFQYYLYTLALCQYLRLKIPEFKYNRDFGGVFYVYLRGFAAPQSANDDSGVFRDKPSLKLVNALGRLLVAGFTDFEE